MDDDEIIDEVMCSCSGTSRGKIYDYVMLGLTVDEISQRTGIKTGCGGCEWDIEAFVKALIESNTDQSN